MTAKPARRVSAPLLGECFANIECKVMDTRFVNKYALFVLEAVQAWADSTASRAKALHHRGHSEFAIDGEIIKLRSAKL